MPEQEDDFEFILEPGKSYWFVVPVEVWMIYRKILKHIFGKNGFQTVKTVEHTPDGGGRKEVFVVLKVGKKPISVSADFMGAPGDYQRGDTPVSLGAWEQAEPHWIVDASEQAEEVKVAVTEWAGTVVENAEELGQKAVDKANEVLDSPERFLQRVEDKSFKIAMILTVAAVGGLAVYRMTERR